MGPVKLLSFILTIIVFYRKTKKWKIRYVLLDKNEYVEKVMSNITFKVPSTKEEKEEIISDFSTILFIHSCYGVILSKCIQLNFYSFLVLIYLLMQVLNEAWVLHMTLQENRTLYNSVINIHKVMTIFSFLFLMGTVVMLIVV